MLGGCLATGGESEPPADATATVGVKGVEPFAPGRPVEAVVDVARAHVTPDRTARIEVSFVNRSPRIFELRAGESDWSVVSDRASDRIHPGLALVGEDDTFRSWSGSRDSRSSDGGGTVAGRDPEPSQGSPSRACWRLDDDTSNPFEARHLTHIGPDETVSTSFEVWGHHENGADACFPTGVFSFGDRYEVVNDGDEFDWGFELRVV